MNIFFLDQCPVEAARKQVRKSAIKMVIECAQLLSTAVRSLPAAQIDPSRTYKATHTNHPCSLWLRRSRQHYEWLVKHALELCRIFNERSGRPHKSQPVIEYCAGFVSWVEDNGFTLTASDLAIQSTEAGRLAYEVFKRGPQSFQDAVAAYQNFYDSKYYVIAARNK